MKREYAVIDGTFYRDELFAMFDRIVEAPKYLAIYKLLRRYIEQNVNADPRADAAIIKECVEAGVSTKDLVDFYEAFVQTGNSEIILSHWLRDDAKTVMERVVSVWGSIVPQAPLEPSVLLTQAVDDMAASILAARARTAECQSEVTKTIQQCEELIEELGLSAEEAMAIKVELNEKVTRLYQVEEQAYAMHDAVQTWGNFTHSDCDLIMLLCIGGATLAGLLLVLDKHPMLVAHYTEDPSVFDDAECRLGQFNDSGLLSNALGFKLKLLMSSIELRSRELLEAKSIDHLQIVTLCWADLSTRWMDKSQAECGSDLAAQADERLRLDPPLLPVFDRLAASAASDSDVMDLDDLCLAASAPVPT